ncbi:MAG: hypothetical protein SH809_14620 [Rhodothermales bacterium]|nr:hypothetical protein [Rhodothermales bacterium]MDZ4700939.1 hypothetical protein [Rhodothermales bacterium]
MVSRFRFGAAMAVLFFSLCVPLASTQSLRLTQIGVIGATTPALPTISSPRGVVVMDDVASIVQAEIDALTAAGVTKIILISHLQGIEQDLELIPMLSGLDIAIAGGGDELLANNDDVLVPGDGTPFGPYPLRVANADGVDVPVVFDAGQLPSGAYFLQYTTPEGTFSRQMLLMK